MTTLLQIHNQYSCNTRNSHPDDCSDSDNENPSIDHIDSSIVNCCKLKILSLNCCSLRSSEKRANLLALIEEHNPDIICGCESHLDRSYYSAEIFPNNYTVLRKDRIEGAGGVFLCINGSLSVFEEPELDVNAEIVWAKITLPKRNSIHLCSFYRPPDLSTDPILQLQSSLNNLISRSTEFPTIILMGDFNFPSIDWSDGSGQLKPCPTYGLELNNLFLDVINDIGFEQYVASPTRKDNILDLVFSTFSIVSDLNIVPGMSDHEAIVFHLDIDNRINYSKIEHKVALYHKANLENIKRDLLEFQTVFFRK